MIRWRRLGLLLLACILSLTLIKLLLPAEPHIPHIPDIDLKTLPYLYGGSSGRANVSSSLVGHPITELIGAAHRHFAAINNSQSGSLAEAVEEYRKRYNIYPPPNFDKWFEFAKERNVHFIDEYDTIHHSLLPFWSVEPVILRERVREAIGYEANAFISLMIRNGRAVKIEGGPQWQRNMTLGMIESFVQFLPDMDVAFNVHDEPRVVVPHDELSPMVTHVLDTVHPRAAAKRPRTAFSKRPKDMTNGNLIPEAKLTRFNEYAHQATWVPSRLSCSPDSPARSFSIPEYHTDDSPALTDNISAYAFSDLNFVRNRTAFTDICLSPSFRHSHGFFDRPNAYKLTHELLPIFSQSKVSSYQDILYPSPWYWYGKTVTDKPPEEHRLQYEEERDVDWKDKKALFWWRGSTTGGFSRDGGWRRQHRQRFVQKINARGDGKILVKGLTPTVWKPKSVPRKRYNRILDIHFSGVGQCDPSDCDAQHEFFQLSPPVDSQLAWEHKFLLDMDGNAFSGRYYSFLKSKSLAFKMGIFREWHEEWLWPWVHYIPLSTHGDDYLEAVRYFAEEPGGDAVGEQLALQSRQWAKAVLRNADMEAWFFRLLLEYGRIIDDDRENIGYAG